MSALSKIKLFCGSLVLGTLRFIYIIKALLCLFDKKNYSFNSSLKSNSSLYLHKIMIGFVALLFVSCVASVANAAICFLPDCKDKKQEFTISDADICMADGYVYVMDLECSEYSITLYCPENSSYIKCDDYQWCIDNGYELTECVVPEYLDEQCPNGQILYRYCTEDLERACQEIDSNYVYECEDGFAKNTDDLCEYSDDYGSCCNLCEGYDYLPRDITEGWHLGASCLACGDITKYKRVIDECEGFQSCPDGGKLGAATCMHGDERWYDECCENLCTLEECPSGTECSYESCSDKYCVVGCLLGYEDYCEVPEMNCAVLGYLDTECEGFYFICPYDETKLYCLMIGGDITNKWCLENGYTITECTPPEYLHNQCPNGELLFESCVRDTERACQDLNHKYVSSCPDGYAKDENDVCTYDSNYASCCNLCEGYDYLLSEIPNGYIAGESCEACGGITKYKAEINPCDGFMACAGNPDLGATTCQHGDEVWYSGCCTHECTLDACPNEWTDCTYEACSEKYCAIGCLVGAEDYCEVPEMDCAVLGYTETSCEYDSLVCPYDSTKLYCLMLGGDIANDWCEENGYTITECTPPEYLHNQCPNGELLFESCVRDTERACQDLNHKYVTSCPDGYAKDENDVCTYDSNYASCCNLCEGYDYTIDTIPTGYNAGESCEACGGVTKYKAVINTCEGYQLCTGNPDVGATTCQHGDEVWHSACCAHECTLDACPNELTECTYEECSGKYCAVGCKAGAEDYCEVPEMDCAVLGYTETSCEYDSLVCPYDSTKLYCLMLGGDIANDWCEENGYTITECTPPEYLHNQCPNGELLFESCVRDTERACQDLNHKYVTSCPDGYEKDESDVCTYDSSYASCCNLCEGYDYTIDTIPTGYNAGESCEACGGVTKYKAVINTCEGYQLCTGNPDVGATTCQHGDEVWHSACCAHECTLDACPNELTECTYEECSGKYCAVGCKAGAEDYCEVPEMDCAVLGYTETSCEYDSLVCPYDSTKLYCLMLGGDIANDWCLENGYTITECTVPQYLTDQCPNGELIYKSCTEDKARACKELNSKYVTSCPDGYEKDESDVCTYDSNYASCCNLCEGYDYTIDTIPTGYSAGESCEACGGVTKYKAVINTCEGYQLCTGNPDVGATTCQHGDEVWHSACCTHECTLDACPNELTECTYEECSGKYCAVGCKTGAIDYCEVPEMDCAVLGYTETSCEYDSFVCPYDSTKLYCLKVGPDVAGDWCRNNGYTITECTIPQYLTDQCPNGELIYKSCTEDKARACKELNSKYVTSCPDGYEKDESDVCTYDSSYASCCSLCEGYDYTIDTIPTGYSAGESCEACGGVTKYKAEVNTCEGYQLCAGNPDVGATTCQRGDEVWYSACCANECTLDACPNELTECTYEECSGKYCAVGCTTGAIDYCSTPEMDCTVLGYTDTSCVGVHFKCPYDETKLHCIYIGENVTG